MSTMHITIHGRDYQIACDDGQEAHLGRLAQEVNDRLQLISKQMGRTPENLHFVLTLLMLADELHDSKTEIAELKRQMHRTEEAGITPAQLSEMEHQMADAMGNITERIESLIHKIDAA